MRDMCSEGGVGSGSKYVERIYTERSRVIPVLVQIRVDES
jgi:hypothetical protein